MKNSLIYSLFTITLIIFSFSSCSSKDDDPVIEAPFIKFNEESIDFPKRASEKTIKVETNIEGISVKSSTEWCTAVLNGNELVVTVEANTTPDLRKAEITLKGEEVTEKIPVNQDGVKTPPTGSIAEDILIPVSSATATSFHSANPIELSFDGDYSTYYITHWTQTTFPVEVIYNFENVETMDYLIYYPRTGHTTNGLLKQVEIWYTTESNPTFTKLGDYDFKASPVSAKINFTTALTKPTQVKFILHEGNNKYAAIGEMEFYRYNPDNFDCLSVFTDYACSELKQGITLSDIESISNPFYKYLATEIYHKDYDPEFRVQQYKAYEHPSVMAAINKTNTYSLLDNPTGIYVDEGEDLIVLANDPGKSNISLQIIDLENGYGSSSSYGLSKGMNKIKTTSKGLIYVMYHTNTGKENPVKINIVTGKVNGYFDSEKHKKEDWSKLLAKASGSYFDVLGKYSHLTFPVEDFKKHTPDGLALINKYDELVYLEMEFMGLVKYNKMFKNRMYFHIDYGDTHMYATSYRTGYNYSTMGTMCNLSIFTASCWGPAHEGGHVNQTRPGIKWQGTTEVTNNIHSLHVQTSFGNTSRLVNNNVYDKAFTGNTSIINAQIPFAESKDVFEQLIPFWQLKLYLVDALGKEDFYKDLYEHYRVTPNLSAGQLTDGVYQLDFVRNTCKIANLDLTEFFDSWGFLRPVDMNVDDYGTKKFTITQQQVDDIKVEIAAKKYPKPKHLNIHLITDLNVSDYK